MLASNDARAAAYPMLAPPLTVLSASAGLGLSFLAASVGAGSAVAWKVLPEASWERAKSGWLAGRVLSVAACTLGT
jgi:hypothetical protein